ncbi:MAG: hypothetical protein HKN64_00655 [Woeseiaceae bacterium]|nr:hypothetical protein [Woeseiaceae bacterium]
MNFKDMSLTIDASEVNASIDKYAAVAVLPPVAGGRVQDPSLRAWLAQSDLKKEPDDAELLARIASVLALPYPVEGLAALRMWGQTGDRPTVWIAGADPVALEARLNHLYLHALRDNELPSADLRVLFDHLQSTLARNDGTGFVRLGHCGYVRAGQPMATAAVPAYVVHQKLPRDYLPQGESAASLRRLLGEIEMSLHDHDVNQRRLAAGRKPVNSLWFWGGGMAPARQSRAQPPLFADDPLLLGYWDSANAIAERWPGSMADCVDAAKAGFVAVAPASRNEPAFLEECLQALRAALADRRIHTLTILFRDGVRADMRRFDRLRFWRRDAPLLGQADKGGGQQ